MKKDRENAIACNDNTCEITDDIERAPKSTRRTHCPQIFGWVCREERSQSLVGVVFHTVEVAATSGSKTRLTTCSKNVESDVHERSEHGYLGGRRSWARYHLEAPIEYRCNA